MASEVQIGHYDFMPPPKERPRAFSDHYTAPIESEQTLTFRANWCHDAESAFWIGLWTLFQREIELQQGDTQYDAGKKEMSFRKLFPGTLGSFDRRFAFKHRRFFMDATNTLPPSLQQAAFFLDQLRGFLNTAYYDAEEKLGADGMTGELDLSNGAVIFTLTIKAFGLARDAVQGIKYKPWSTEKYKKKRGSG